MPNFHGATRGSTNSRGYGHDAHQIPRAAAFAALPEHSPCCRCGKSMWKWTKEGPDSRGRYRSALHYDHNDARTGYLGFSCAPCNRKAGAAKGGRIANARHSGRHGRPRLSWRSRIW